MKPWWDVLGIPRDSDRAAKRRAYAALLKVTNPEDDPAGFMALRQAYEASLSWIDYGDWEDDDAEYLDGDAAFDPDPPAPTVRQPFIAPVAVAPEPSPRADPAAARHAAEHAELRQLTAALEAALRGPWFKGESELDFYLSRILAAPALIELETRDRIEYWLADLLADTVPRSDAILSRAIEAFRWDQEGEHPPGAWRVLARIDEWRLIEALGRGGHELAAGWRTLTRSGEPVWQRRIGALRPGIAGQVRRLFDLADYQTPGIAHSFDPLAAAWWRDHLARARFGFVDLAVLLVTLAVALALVMLARGPAVRWGGGAAVIVAGALFPFVRLRFVAPWRARRDADDRPPGWASHGWIGLWAAALLLLVWTPAGPWMAATTVALSVGGALWMAVTVGREPRIGNPIWKLVSFGALALVGGFAFFSMSGPAQAALAAFAIASLIIAAAGANAIAELLWRVGEKPVLAAAVAALLLLAAAAVRMALPAPPPPLLPWGAAAIAGMVLTVAVRELHDGSFTVRLMPLLRWGLWMALVVSAILSTPEVPRDGAPPIAIGAADPLARLEQSEPGFTALRSGNPGLFRQIAAVTERQRKGELDAAAAMREIDRLVNTAYRDRLPLATPALIAAEMDIRLATMREQQQRDPGGCASDRAAVSFTPSEALRKRHYRHALTVAGASLAPLAQHGAGRELAMRELYRLAADGDARRADELARAMAGPDARAKCAAQIAMLEALTAQPDGDIAKTIRPGLIDWAAEKSAKKKPDQAP